jgi:hypothetical protein
MNIASRSHSDPERRYDQKRVFDGRRYEALDQKYKKIADAFVEFAEISPRGPRSALSDVLA